MKVEEVYGLQDRDILTELCSVDTQFVRQLATLSYNSASTLKTVSFTTPAMKEKYKTNESTAIIDLADLPPLSGEYGASKNLVDEIAKFRVQSSSFLNVPDFFWEENKTALAADYLLASSLCLVEVFSGIDRVDKFFATRNRYLAGALAGVSPSETVAYTSHLQTLPINYQMQKVKILKMSLNSKGYKITKTKKELDLSGNIRITPFFLLSTFVKGITNLLDNNIIKFKYLKDNLVEREFISTTSISILNDYYDQETVQKVMTNMGQFLGRGYLKLPELGISKYDRTGVRSLNISRITQMEIIKEFDTSYIEVDFDMILPNLYETIRNIHDIRVLHLIHEDLTGKTTDSQSILEIQEGIISFIEVQYTIGTTTVLRHLHKYMVQREKFFPAYHGGKPRQFGSTGGSSFTLGLSED